MNSINDIQLIELYCENALSEAEQKTVEQRLQNDLEFSVLYKQYIQLTEGIERIGSNETKQFIEKIEQDLPKINVAKRRTLTKKHWTSIAASIFILLSFQFFLTNSSADIYKAYHQAYPLLLDNTLRGEALTEVSESSKAYEAYASGKYEDVVKLFDKQSSQLSDTELFYKANALLEIGENKAALELFQRVRDNSNLFEKQAKWYVGLCYLNMNQKNNAIKVFEEIVNTNDSYKTKAQEILDAIQ